jgi:cytochrome c
MKALTAALTAAALLMAGSAIASEELVKKNACIGCHDMSAKKVGPTWKDIAAKNKGAKPEALVEAIVKGGKGKYGKIPMPPQAKAEADAPAIAKWILSL